MLGDAREAAGLSQGELAALIPCHRTQVTRVEAATRVPSAEFVKACERVLGTGGRLYGMWERVDWYRKVEHPDWFRRYAKLESEADTIRTYQVSLVHGLLQTESYARALIARAVGEDKPVLIEERVAARMSRQQRLFSDDAPTLIAVLDESAIRRMVGGPEVMHEQLCHLLVMGRRPNVVIQIAPLSLGERVPFDTAMILVASPDGTQRIYSESLDHGHFVEAPNVVRDCERAYDRLRADALPARESAHLIRSAMKGLLNMSTTTPDLSGAPWRKSTYSGGNGGDCVEVADGFAGLMPVRDSKDPEGPALLFAADAWRAFVAGVRGGEFPVGG
ncbi:Scr1 family TA system antitoxin-like transcriptional regulator [Kitasatospora kazusensis]